MCVCVCVCLQASYTPPLLLLALSARLRQPCAHGTRLLLSVLTCEAYIGCAEGKQVEAGITLNQGMNS